MITLVYLLLGSLVGGSLLPELTNGGCSVRMVESIPENLTYAHTNIDNIKTFQVWKDLLTKATKSVKVTGFYWTLTGKDLNITDPSTKQGEEILELFKGLPKRGIELKVAQSGAERPIKNLDEIIAAGGKAVYVDMDMIFGSGVLHNKIWIVDGRHGYLGSANMDFRSLTQVKELGVAFHDCPEIMNDLDKIFEAYWYVGARKSVVPKEWPASLKTAYNMDNNMLVVINDKPSDIYLSMSPPNFRPPGRTNDLDGLLNVIETAKDFIFISVMTYSPEIVIYGNHSVTTQFWPVIDDALRRAALDRKVEVRLLISHWKYTAKTQIDYLKSLKAISGIKGSQMRIRNFIVPAYNEFQKKLDHARVNHNKYMVTDNKVFIGTSNWSGDYFLTTGGCSFIGNDNSSDPKSLREQTVNIFRRDWNSEYAYEL